MKRITIAAGALLLGTSAFAFTPSSEPVAQSDKEPTLTLAAESNDLPKADPSSAELQTSFAEKTDKLSEADPDLDLAETPEPDKGMGGPIEEATAAAPAAGTYPPCRPGPGDDNCIQLYEPGVRASLASWTPRDADTVLAGEMGEATSSAEASAVGGPYEPVEGSGETAMNGDGVVDAATGETAELEFASAAEHKGVGGPIAETGYPPCAPGPGDDRCIQLYEPGVTGAGN